MTAPPSSATSKPSPAPEAQTFRLRTQLLKKGRTHTILASTKNDRSALNVAIKSYAGGGENEFHTHALEDHTFIILQGRATFQQPDKPSRTLGRNEGILLPAGSFYKFEAVGDEPLVILRVGNVWQPLEGAIKAQASKRVGLDGGMLPANSVANKHIDPVPIEGAYYE
jgi:mannose-6-phosphate isomerase-like protein (cupin superfamily)